MLTANLKHSAGPKKDVRLFNKILRNLSMLPYPGGLKQIIKTFMDDGAKIRKDESYEKNYLLSKYGSIPPLKYFDMFKGD